MLSDVCLIVPSQACSLKPKTPFSWICEKVKMPCVCASARVFILTWLLHKLLLLPSEMLFECSYILSVLRLNGHEAPRPRRPSLQCLKTQTWQQFQTACTKSPVSKHTDKSCSARSSSRHTVHVPQRTTRTGKGDRVCPFPSDGRLRWDGGKKWGSQWLHAATPWISDSLWKLLLWFFTVTAASILYFFQLAVALLPPSAPRVEQNNLLPTRRSLARGPILSR